MLIFADVRPPWLEWASSMMMANFRPRCSSPISSRMNGNFWTVEMMIFLPPLRNRRRSPLLLGMAHRGRHLGKLLDGVLDLLVQHPPVGDHDHRVEPRLAAVLQADELVRQPGDGVALAAAGRVLDQIPLAGAACLGVGQEFLHHVELVVAGEDLLALLLPLVVLFLHDLGVVLDDVREPGLGQNLLPQVVGLEAALVGRVAGPVVPALVEGQKPRILALEVRAHPHFLVVHREVHHAAAELKQQLLGFPVALVLLHRIIHGLFGQAVLELKGGHRQAVDEEAQVQGELGLVLAVAQLPGDAEDIGRKAFLGLDVAGGGRAVEQVQAHRPVLDPVAQHVDDAALGDLALEPVEELGPPGAVLGQVQRLRPPWAGWPSRKAVSLARSTAWSRS